MKFSGASQGGSASEFSPQINDAAAMLFWTHAAQHGFQTTVERVVATQCVCLFEQEQAAQILESHGFFELPEASREVFMRAIGLEVKDSIEREENLLGIVYAEDAATGRSPTAASVDVTRVCARPTRLSGYEHLERLGELCLRHPLPAVVFAETQPGTRFIQVASTHRALGCEVPMFLSLTGCVEIAAQVFALSGVFYILVRDNRIGDLWGGVIQNSVRSTAQIAVRLNGTVHSIEAQWS